MKIKNTIEQLRHRNAEIRQIRNSTPEKMVAEHGRIFDAFVQHEKLYMVKGCERYDMPINNANDMPRREYDDDE